MSRRSLDSERPIMAPSLASKRASKRYSQFSASPSFATVDILESSCIDSSNLAKHPAGNLNVTAASGMAEIKQITKDLEKLDNKQLSQQRYVPTQKKRDELSTLNLGAKLERSLGRRMQSQDAVFSPKWKGLGEGGKRMSILGEKRMEEVLSEKS